MFTSFLVGTASNTYILQVKEAERQGRGQVLRGFTQLVLPFLRSQGSFLKIFLQPKVSSPTYMPGAEARLRKCWARSTGLKGFKFSATFSSSVLLSLHTRGSAFLCTINLISGHSRLLIMQLHKCLCRQNLFHLFDLF